MESQLGNKTTVKSWTSRRLGDIYGWLKPTITSKPAYASMPEGSEDVQMSDMGLEDEKLIGEDEGTGPPSEMEMADEEERATNAGEHMSGLHFWLVFGSVLISLFVACFDMTLMGSTHPVITSHFHSSNSASWLSTAFLLTTTAFQPLFGRMSDTFGRRPLLVFTLAIFAMATAWCALAQSIGSFIAGRAFAGLGAGGTMAMGAILTNDIIRIEVRGAYQSLINLFFGVGAACGAAFGGYLAETLGWRWTFGVQIPFISTSMMLGALFTPRNLGPQLAKSGKNTLEILRSFDLLGSFFLSLTIACLVLALNLGGNILPWTHPIVITSLILCVPLGALTLRIESRHPRPVMPLEILFSQPRGNMVFANYFAHIGFNTILFNAPLYFQVVKSDTPSQSGFRLTLPALATCIFGISSGLYMTWTGRLRGLLFSGVACMLLGGTLVTVAWDGIPTWLMTLFLIPAQMGQGLNFPATTIGLLSISQQEEQAVISSTLTLWRDLGIVSGVSLSSLVLQGTLKRNLELAVTGENKEQIILQVRKSVETIRNLDALHLSQVIFAYRHSLTLTFALAVLSFVVVLLLTVSVKLPALSQRKQQKAPK